MVHFSAKPKNEPHFSLFASEASNRLSNYILFNFFLLKVKQNKDTCVN
ncbi:MAG: hypothetical protein U5L45_08730 [Saprospiraceae bacterium]|nr:hypothetical protein [Saprospiraceae bacterium]